MKDAGPQGKREDEALEWRARRAVEANWDWPAFTVSFFSFS